MSREIDLSHVSCGLVPAMVAQLAETKEDELVFRIRAGIKAEIISGFGSGGVWDFSFRHGVGHDEVRFRRKHPAGTDPRLSLLDY
ncbi:hypothetical protein M7784_16625 [Desulfovibrio aminophilus]|nr:hypothetical protein [Desulfovibrio aminophilus]MCM0756861.1 hypothetical protein [Desulfovibrio aminophilus]